MQMSIGFHRYSKIFNVELFIKAQPHRMSLKLRQKDELNDPQGSVQSYGFGSDLEL